MVTATAPARLVPAVDRAVRVLACLEAEARPLGVSEIARRLDASKGSVHDVLETLRRHGLLDRDDASKQYWLGARLVRLGAAARSRLDLAAVARPVMARLAEESGETVLLLRRQGDRALIVEKAEASNGIMRISASVGQRIPLGAGASGKLFFAFGEPPKSPPRFTDRSLAEPSTFEGALRAARAEGFALDDQEYLDGVRAAAAPIFGVHGDLVGVLLTVGLAGSLTVDRLAPVARATARAAADISTALGAPSALLDSTPAPEVAARP